MLEFAVELKAPVVIRYPRGGEEKKAFASHKEISLGESELLKDGNDLTIIGIGKTTKKGIRCFRHSRKKKGFLAK